MSQNTDGNLNDNFQQQKRKTPKGNDILLATWNVKTMLQPDKMVEILQETDKAHIDITAL